MSTSTYLQGVNNSITELGAELASFLTDGSDFTTNTNSLMQRIRGWYARAWKDIQQSAYDWEWMEEQGLCNVDPGVMFYTDGTAVSLFSKALSNSTFNILDQDGTIALSVAAGKFKDLTGNGTTTLPFGYFSFNTLGGSQLSSSLKPGAEYFTISVTTTYSVSEGIAGSAPAVFTSYVRGIPSTDLPAPVDITVNGVEYLGLAALTASTASFVGLSYNTASGLQAAIAGNTGRLVITDRRTQKTNVLDMSLGTFSLSPVTSNNNVTVLNRAYVHSWKSFDFNEELQFGDFQELIHEIDQSSFRIIDFYKAPATGEAQLTFVSWEEYIDLYDQSSAAPGFPTIITEDNTGRYRLYPHPMYTVSIKFDYNRTPQILSAYTDTLKGLPENFFDLVMWQTLIYYGEYEEQPSVVLRATKNYKTLLTRVELKYRPKFHFAPKRLY